LRRLFVPSSETKEIRKKIDELGTSLHQFTSLLSMKCQLPPIPPKHLQVRVAGAYYSHFFEHGRKMFEDIDKILQAQGISILHFKSVLDFGCGCGRFLIPVSCIADPKRFSGTDIDREAITWLKNNYSCFQDLDVNGPSPPTKYEADTFHFIFGVSIFTHLPEDMQHAWLKELSRIIQPGGYGIFTTHGRNHFHHLNEAAREELLKKGFYYLTGQATDGLPDFYQTSFHTHEYIAREWSRYFEIVALREKGIGGHQDAVLVRKAV